MGKNMKKTLLALAAMAFSGIAMAQEIDTEKLSAHDKNAPVGWGAGVTGGEGGTTVTVETYSALKAQLAAFDQTKKTIYVKGTITFDGQMEVRGVKNKTIIGLEGATLQNLNEDIATSSSDKSAAIAKTGIMLLRDCDNIAIRNLIFKSAGACDFNANDNLCAQGSTNIWVDHCDFQDGVDGNFDIVNASDNISVTWCRFRYLLPARGKGYGGSSTDHRFTNLIGNSDKTATSDEGKLRTTFYSCWWDEGCKERMPRVRFGKVHTLNCLYTSSVTSYCVGGGYKSNVYIENCAFIGNKPKNTPWKDYADEEKGYPDYNVTIAGCQNVADKQARDGSNDYFIPANEYSGYYSYAASEVESTVSNGENGAGATLKFKDSSGIQGVAAGSQVTAVEYYTLDGRCLQEPQRGINIQVTRRADGTKQTKKIIY